MGVLGTSSSKFEPIQRWRMLCDTGNPRKHTVSADVFTEDELEDDVNLTIFMSRAPLSLSDECPVD